MHVVVVGICGGSGAGKTFLADALAAELGDTCARVSFDSYYHDLSAMTPAARAEVNYDHPDSLEDTLLAQHLVELKARRAVEVPVYDFATHTRPGSSIVVAPAPVVIVDGILLLASAPVRDAIDLAIYVDAPQDLRFERRIRRDVSERGRTAEMVRTQLAATVEPMHQTFVGPASQHADLVVTGIGAVDQQVAEIIDRIEALRP